MRMVAAVVAIGIAFDAGKTLCAALMERWWVARARNAARFVAAHNNEAAWRVVL